jgi:hypothetical protein
MMAVNKRLIIILGLLNKIIKIVMKMQFASCIVMHPQAP